MSEPAGEPPPKIGPKTGDYVAGAGGGGILVYCAQHFIDEPTAKQAAVYACPAISMFIVRLYARLSTFSLRQWDYYIGEFERKRLLKRSAENIAEMTRCMRPPKNVNLPTQTR
jgi:hypothetical protein